MLNQFTLSASVAQTASLVGPGGLGRPVDTVELAVLPAPHTEQKTHDIALLLPVQLLHVLVRSHLELQIIFKMTLVSG